MNRNPPDSGIPIGFNPTENRSRANDAEFGADLYTMEELARRKDYVLVASSLYSCNAYFVRHDLVGNAFSAPFTAERFTHALDY